MGETTITIIAIFLAAVLMFIFPLMAVSEQHDSTATLVVQSATSEFVDKITTKGKVTQDDYDAYIQKIGATGNTYDVEIERQILDENPGKKATLISQNSIGENLRYSVYTSDILNVVNNDGTYNLKKGDYIIITAKNTNSTMAQTLRNFLYSLVSGDTYQVGATYSSMVINDGK